MKWIHKGTQDIPIGLELLLTDGEHIWIGHRNKKDSQHEYVEDYFGCTNDECNWIEDLCCCEFTFIPTHWMFIPSIKEK